MRFQTTITRNMVEHGAGDALLSGIVFRSRSQAEQGAEVFHFQVRPSAFIDVKAVYD